MGFEPCLSALERPTRAVRSETIAVRSFTSSVKSVWASPPIKWRALPGTRAADSKDDSIRAADSRPILPSHRACAKKEGRQTATLQRKCTLFRCDVYIKLSNLIVATPRFHGSNPNSLNLRKIFTTRTSSASINPSWR